MPRRPIFTNNNLSLWGRFKSLITDKYTWFTLAYMIMQLPLGIRLTRSGSARGCSAGSRPGRRARCTVNRVMPEWETAAAAPD